MRVEIDFVCDCHKPNISNAFDGLFRIFDYFTIRRQRAWSHVLVGFDSLDDARRFTKAIKELIPYPELEKIILRNPREIYDKLHVEYGLNKDNPLVEELFNIITREIS